MAVRHLETIPGSPHRDVASHEVSHLPPMCVIRLLNTPSSYDCVHTFPCNALSERHHDTNATACFLSSYHFACLIVSLTPSVHRLIPVLQHGSLFEKAGVNVSQLTGILSETRAAAMASRGRVIPPGTPYSAAALSFVLHSQSPFIPTLRGDVRIFAAAGRVWGGGGADLTIFYVDRPAFSQFHAHWRDVCDQFNPAFYPRFKRWCDDYFYLPARGEHRGVGGIFYDDLDLPGDELIRFQSAVLHNFLPSFQHIVNAQLDIPWTDHHKRWQRIRRGRYIEFNLLNDRGVRFGLAGAPPSRTDSIMISAPPSVEWPYRHEPAPDSPEAETLQLLSGKPIDWVDTAC